MKIKKPKRIMSLFLAALMCVTSLVGIGTTAYAAEETDDVYLISYPRDGDSNYNAEWGHGSLTFMNGWKTGNSRYTTVRAMGSYTGNICYCIEIGVPQQTGDSFTKKGEDFWDNYPSSYNSTISPDDIKLFIGRIFQYGYTGTISTSWRSQNEGGDKLAHAVATQLLIWETVIGERDENFNKVSTGGKDAVLDQISPNHPLYDKIMSYYNSMAASVQKHSKLPSFLSKTPGSAQEIELEWDGSKYTVTLTDSNNVLSGYKFSSNDSGVQFSVSGNKLTITAEKAPSDGLTITAEKTAQRKGVITWTDGIYGPNGGVQDTVTYAQTVNDPVKGFLKSKVSYGSAKIVKTSEDGKVDGISFRIQGNGIDKTVKTENGGQIQVDNLMPGVYTVTEQEYDRYEPQESRRVTVVAGQVATVNFNNTLKRGDIEVIKSSEDNFNEGVTFHLYGTSLSGIAVDEYAVTDKNGVATFEDVLISGTTPYTIEEVDTAIRYVIPADQSAPVKWNEVTTRNFTNILKKFTVTVTKSDAETGTAQGNASLAGAKYGIFKGEQLIDEYYTDENGQFTTKEYICGADWTIKELEPSEGYLLDPTVHKVGAEPELYTIEHNQTANDVTEQVIKGNIAIIKHTDDGETQIETPEEGAVFEVYLKSAGSFANAKESERDTLICDENGFAQTKDMPYGTYTVHQVSGWEGRELMDDFDVFIAKDAQTYRYLINNSNFESYIQVVKVDAETGKTIPYAGAGFQIYDPSGNLITMEFTYPTPTTVDTFYTDANGSLVTPEKLPYGQGYSIVEVQSPYGYVLDSTPVYFDVTEENSSEESGVTVIKVEKTNMPQKGTISIEKTGEVFFGVLVSGGTDENGQELPVIYQPMGFREGNILEPSCGIGNFIGMLPQSMQDSKIYGVEIDKISAGIAQQLYQKTSIATQPFEEANIPDSFFDAVIGNVPFGDIRVNDRRYNKHNFLIHDYFFAKSLDKLRPGGVMALITSKGTMDKENPAVRKYIAQRADLLGAIRLPNNTFKGNAGTEVVSDILILQKRDRLIDLEPEWVHLNTDENGVKMNAYFVDHPEMVLGEWKTVSGRFGEEDTVVPYENADLAELLDEAISNIHAEITDYEVDEELTEEDNSIPADPEVRNFSYTVVDDKIYYRENSRMTPVECSATAENRIKGMIVIRDCVRSLIEMQIADYPDYEIEKEQQKLNALYDTFSKKYGLINSRANVSAFSQDSSFALLSALEVLDENGELERKADMFTKRTIKPHTPVTTVDTASEALAVSMGEKACVDMEYMCSLTGKTEQEIYEELKGVIFLNPMYGYGNSTERKYLMADEYLSGNVREKLAWAKKSAEVYPEDYKINVEALEKVQPKDLTASEIFVQLGTTWLPEEIAQQFMYEFLDTPRYAQWNIKVHYSKLTGEWNVEGKSYDRGNLKAYNTYGTKRVNAYKIIEDTLNMKDVRVFDYMEDDEGKRRKARYPMMSLK